MEICRYKNQAAERLKGHIDLESFISAKSGPIAMKVRAERRKNKK